MQSRKQEPWFGIIVCLIILVIARFFCLSDPAAIATNMPLNSPPLLTDPFLQLPTANSVNVVWFTEFEGDRHWALVGEKLDQKFSATTTKLSRVREDENSNLELQPQQLQARDVWRHEAIVTGLESGDKVPYQVFSTTGNETISSKVFSLRNLPSQNSNLKILLTSDHQLMPMTAANMQKVSETMGQVDGVFFAGDLVNFPDRASEWFDDNLGGAFFPNLQGKASYQLEKEGKTEVYRGGEIIQNAPLFSCLGNHEVMGRHSENKTIRRQFYDAFPRDPNQTKPITNDIKNQSFNTDTYEEIFSLPQSKSGGKQYYATTFGDVRLVVLYVTCIWRFPELTLDLPARYQENPDDFEQPEKWGNGQHIFESIRQGSKQYQWLESELKSDDWQNAKYKVVMFHHPPHTLGGNIVPPYTDPVQTIERDANQQITNVTYEYPKAKDYIVSDLVPLLESAGTQLVLYGHSHLWNRFQSETKTHFLETSNVGNSYGAHTADNPREVPDNPNYATVGNPNGLEPIVPNLRPLQDDAGQPMPYIASNDFTAFSILDTGKGTVASYYFDTRKPDSEVVKFDEFELGS